MPLTQSPLILLLALLVTPAESFIPARSAPFVPGVRNEISTTNSYDNRVFHTGVTPIARSSSNSVMQMNLFDRFVRVAKGNLNNVLKNLEAPEKIMNQAVEDMQNDLLKVRQSYAEITATQRKLIKQKEATEARAKEWQARAQLALRKGNESLAREALVRRQQQLEILKGVQSQLDLQGAAADKLYEGMKALEAKIIEVRGKKEQFVARAKAAESTQKVNDMLSGITGKTSMDAFKRMEEKVEALEAAAEASVELSSIEGSYLLEASDLDIENEFLRLEGSAAVDNELKRMKMQLPPSESLPKVETYYDPAIDSQLEKMKKENEPSRTPSASRSGHY